MSLYVAGLIVLLVGGAAALVAGRRPLANTLGALTAVAGGLLTLVSSAATLAGGAGAQWDLMRPWAMPGGSLHLGMDELSAFFAICISLISVLAAIYGRTYLADQQGRRHLGASWLFYNVLLASMLGVVASRNALLFLVAWELMSLSSFLLVMFDDKQPGVVSAGWTYLVAAHLGTAFLLVLFLLLGSSGSLEFSDLAAGPNLAGVCFVLALIGFGTKAGLVPLHVWLPEAHPAAPSHVSAVMSGVMIKTGIYGLLRILMLLGTPAIWWGYVLIGLGAISGVLGVLFALAQHDLKRLLAYHSVENIGIIVLGLGLGVLGAATNQPAMAVLGFAGGLLHVFNHAIFKSLLFLGAGSVAHAAGTRDLESLGGLLKRMPTTGATFLIGSAAIAGLPPLNGFVSELLIYLGAFGSAAARAGVTVYGAVAVILALGLIGGLALACFAKAFGIVFLGEPRTAAAAGAHESPAAMRWPMVVLAGLCIAIGLGCPLVAEALRPTVYAVAGALGLSVESDSPANEGMALVRRVLPYISLVAGALLVMIGGAGLLRWRLLRGRAVEPGLTWDCGYAAPTPRMQYTASSFADPILKVFRRLIRQQRQVHPPEGLLPAEASLHTHAQDPFTEGGYRPAFLAVMWLSGQVRRLQGGRNQVYVLYIALALLVLLVWKLGL
jgi:formate hydrogenlyase subunit 3/multisubunit Na+/H+ antiporter MnhD subunit